MATSAISTAAGGTFTKSEPTVINGRPDYEFAKALDKVSPQTQAKAQKTATEFEGMFSIRCSRR